MAKLSPELIAYLESSDSPKQVLIKVKARHQPQSPKSKDETPYLAHLRASDANRADLIQALEEEHARDSRVEFNPLGMFNQVALRAPREVIMRLAEHQDVDEIIPDEPTDVVSELDI